MLAGHEVTVKAITTLAQRAKACKAAQADLRSVADYPIASTTFGDVCRRAEVTRDCPMGHAWRRSPSGYDRPYIQGEIGDHC